MKFPRFASLLLPVSLLTGAARAELAATFESGAANDIRIDRLPALLVKASRSPRISPDILAEVKSYCPGIDFAEVADSDHHVTLDNPAGFVHAVRDFLEKRR